MTWHPVAKLGDVRPGDVVAVAVAVTGGVTAGVTNGVTNGTLELVLARDGDAIVALQRRCPHQAGDLADGILSRGHVICPQHGWRFAAATGRLDGASDVCLVRYPTRVVGDQIEVDPTPIPKA